MQEGKRNKDLIRVDADLHKIFLPQELAGASRVNPGFYAATFIV